MLVYFLVKAFAVYVVTQWIKGTFPRVRIDQMMSFAWKVLGAAGLGADPVADGGDEAAGGDLDCSMC